MKKIFVLGACINEIIKGSFFLLAGTKMLLVTRAFLLGARSYERGSWQRHERSYRTLAGGLVVRTKPQACRRKELQLASELQLPGPT